HPRHHHPAVYGPLRGVDAPGAVVSKPQDRLTEERMSNPSLALHHDAFGRLALTDALGRQHLGVMPVRAFPFTSPTEGISLLDGAGREVLWINRLEDLPEEVQKTVAGELERRAFVPVIRRIHSVAPRVEPSEWDVQTDRGRTR